MGLLSIISDAFTGKALKEKVEASGKTKIVSNVVIPVTPVSAVASSSILTSISSTIGKIGSAIKSAFVSSPVKTTAVAAGVTVATSAVVASPKAQESIAKTPSSLVNFGTNIGELIEEPSLAKAKEIFVENPLLSSAVAAGVTTAVGVGTAGIISNVANVIATKENTKALGELGQIAPVGATNSTDNLSTQKVPAILETSQNKPYTAETETIEVGTKKRKKYKKSKTTTPSIKQSVNITFDNDKVDNKRYLNRRKL